MPKHIILFMWFCNGIAAAAGALICCGDVVATANSRPTLP